MSISATLCLPNFLLGSPPSHSRSPMFRCVNGLNYSTPFTATLVSLILHTVALWAVVFLTMGRPQVALAAVVAIVVTGILQPIMRHCHYTGIHKLGTSRAVTLRNTFPLPAVLIGILFLGEPITPLGIVGTVSVVAGIVLTSRRIDKQLPSFHWTHLMYPVATALITAVVHPLRRYALIQSHEPLFFTAVVGPVSLLALAAYYVTQFAKRNWSGIDERSGRFLYPDFSRLWRFSSCSWHFRWDRLSWSRPSPPLLRSGPSSSAQFFCARLKGSPWPAPWAQWLPVWLPSR